MKRPEVLFKDRQDAGQRLAEKLHAYTRRADAVVLALPRGGVPVGGEVARILRMPLDVFLVRKLGLPWKRELAMGAIASGGVRVLNEAVLKEISEAEATLEAVTVRERAELERREAFYRADQPRSDVEGKTALIVDDGLATGSTMRAAVRALRERGTARIVVAVPVGPASTCAKLEKEADEVVCVVTPKRFAAVGQFYDDFDQTSDEEVRALLLASGTRDNFHRTPG